MRKLRLSGISALALGLSLGLVPPALAQSASSPFVQPTENPEADELAQQMRVLASEPTNVAALVRAAEITIDLGDLTAARGFLDRASRILPNDARMKAAQGSWLVASERPGEALQRFADAERLGWPVRNFAARRALAWDLVGQQGRAQRDYKLALATQRDDETQRRYALSLAIAGQREPALELIDAQLRRSDRAAWRTRAFILALAGDQSGATRISSSMMPANMVAGMQAFFSRLPTMTAAEKAFAVHFGELRATPERLADARFVPAVPQLAVEVAPSRAPTAAPVQVAASSSKKSKKERKAKPGRVEMASATSPNQPQFRSQQNGTPAGYPAAGTSRSAASPVQLASTGMQAPAPTSAYRGVVPAEQNVRVSPAPSAVASGRAPSGSYPAPSPAPTQAWRPASQALSSVQPGAASLPGYAATSSSPATASAPAQPGAGSLPGYAAARPSPTTASPDGSASALATSSPVQTSIAPGSPAAPASNPTLRPGAGFAQPGASTGALAAAPPAGAGVQVATAPTSSLPGATPIPAQQTPATTPPSYGAAVQALAATPAPGAESDTRVTAAPASLPGIASETVPPSAVASTRDMAPTAGTTIAAGNEEAVVNRIVAGREPERPVPGSPRPAPPAKVAVAPEKPVADSNATGSAPQAALARRAPVKLATAQVPPPAVRRTRAAALADEPATGAAAKGVAARGRRAVSAEEEEATPTKGKALASVRGKRGVMPEPDEATPTKSKTATITRGKRGTAADEEEVAPAKGKAVASTRGRRGAVAEEDGAPSKGRALASTRGKRGAAVDEDDPAPAKGKGSAATRTAAAKAKKPVAKPDPERYWVQVAGGANPDDLAKAWKKAQGANPVLKGRQGYATPLRATNRVLTGPFKSQDEAQAFVNKLAGSGTSAFTFTSTAGQKVDKLPTP